MMYLGIIAFAIRSVIRISRQEGLTDSNKNALAMLSGLSLRADSILETRDSLEQCLRLFVRHHPGSSGNPIRSTVLQSSRSDRQLAIDAISQSPQVAPIFRPTMRCQAASARWAEYR